MNEEQVAKTQLPTGEEPPKGYETLAKEPDDGLHVDFVMFNHLAKSERAEIEALRSRALGSIQKYTGLSNAPLSLEREVGIIKEIEDSNKMLALAFFENRLAGYSLVITGWPKSYQWIIQHMIIDPQMRHRGVGFTIVTSIERYASECEVAADSIFAVPVQESGKEFWQENGYTVEAARFLVTVAEVDHELIVYHKAL